MNKIWNELLEFETRDLVDRFMKKRFGGKPNARKIQQITSNFIQGREYFKSAEGSSLTVRPLLQYYGVMALSKGLILCLNVSLTEDQLKSSHGLEIKNWKEVFKSKDFEHLEITFGEGTFSELIRETENKNYLRGNSTGVNWSAKLRTPSKGDTISLKQLINYFPDLDKEYESWTNEKLKYAVIESYFATDQNGEIKLRGVLDQEAVDLLFPVQYCINRTIDINSVTNKTSIKFGPGKWGPNITQKWHGQFDIGDACVIPVVKGDIGLNLLTGMYVISYVFGMMARYYPSIWVSLRRVETGDRVYPFALRILDFVQDKFPRQVLDFLNSPYKFESK